MNITLTLMSVLLHSGDMMLAEAMSQAVVVVDRTFNPRSLAELSAKAEVILVGEVTDRQDARLANPADTNSSILTDFTIKVRRNVKGGGGTESVIVTERGGKLGMREGVPGNYRLMKAQEQYVLFLQKDDRPYQPSTPGTPRYVVTGVWAGKFLVDASGKVRPQDETVAEFKAYEGQALDEFLARLPRQ